MNTLKDLLDKLYKESEERNEENEATHDYESISYEVGVQSTIKEIREWVENHSWLNVDDSIVVRYKDDF
jgi:hypothetical protein